MNQLYPVFIKLSGRPCLVVGGGTIAHQKARALLEAGGKVTVVSPDLGPELAALRDAGSLAWIARRYARGDLVGAFLAFAAVDDPAVSEEIFREAEERGVLFNAVDRDPHCLFHVPATARRGDLQVAVSSGGKSPALAALLRDRIALGIDGRLERFAAALGELRPRALARWPHDPARRQRVLKALARSLRPVDGVGGAALRLAGERSGETKRGAVRGTVYLVGAGPGDPGLLTLRAAELIESADVIFHDRLVGSEILRRIPPGVARVYVGKEAGVGGRPDTGALLVRAARAGKAVVRLKGGDPFVFGRGGEEALALRRAGVPFEVVPGVSAVNGAAAAASIPLTFRGLAREVVIRSGYREELDSSDGSAGTTFVYLMTIGRLSEIVAELLAGGIDPATPAALIERGTLPDQRLLIATVGTLEARAAREALLPPAMLVCGEVVRFASSPEEIIALAEREKR